VVFSVALTASSKRRAGARSGVTLSSVTQRPCSRPGRGITCSTRSLSAFAKQRDDDIALARLAVADRNLAGWPPEIELADLARTIDRALKRPRRQKQRTHFAQIVINDALAATEAKPLDQLTNADLRQLRIATQQHVNLVPERVQLRRALRALEPRRIRRAQRRPDGVARQPRSTLQLLIETPRTKCSRRSSAHRSTSSTASSWHSI
jgi:hypothetical protein